MRGWLIVNHFVRTAKFEELFGMLKEAAEKLSVELERVSNSEMWRRLAEADYLFGKAQRPDFVLFWDKDLRLAYELERQGLRLYNSAAAIEACDDKCLTWLKCRHGGLRQPLSIISPKKFHNDGLVDEELAACVKEKLGYPCVMKEAFGSFGQQVHLAENEEELLRQVRDAGERPYLLQEYIAESKGRDIRVQVVGDRVIAAMLRENENDFRANLTNGGSAKDYSDQLSVAWKEMALQAVRVLGLDFAGVDILFGPEGEPVLCEVNSNAHFKNLYDCTGVNAADAILRHIIESTESGI